MKQFYFKMIKIPTVTAFFGILFLLASQVMQAATITSTSSGGDWNSTSTWVGGVVPANSTADKVIIVSGATVTLTLTANFTVGGLNIEQGAALNVSSNATANTFTIGVQGSTISGPLFFDNTVNGTKSFGTVTVSSTGSVIETIIKSISMNNGAQGILTNYGTITTGTLAMSGTNASLMVVNNYGTINTTGGSSTSVGTFNNYFGGVLNINGTIAGTIKNYGTINSSSLSGTATVANLYNYSTGVINFTGGTMTAGYLNLYVSDPGNTVNYSSPNSQTVKLPADGLGYSNLILSNTSGITVTKTIGSQTYTTPSKTETFAASSILCSKLLLSGVVKASITNADVKAGKLIIDGVGKNAGTYAGTNSISPAPNFVNFTSFLSTATGYLTVSSSVPNWTGATNTSWSTASNWSTGAAPATGFTGDITIASGNPVLDTDFTVGSGGSLLLSGSASLTVAPTATLSVTGTADFGGKPVTFKSDANGTARFGKLLGTLTGATNVTVERFIPARRAFRLLSSPVTTTVSGATTIFDNWQLGTHITGAGGASNGFDATGTDAPSLFTHDNANQAWVAVTNTSTNILTAGVPYRIMVRGDRSIDLTNPSPTATNATLTAKGTLKTGTVAVAGLSTAADGYSLIGNPYQSPVDMAATLTAATNLKNFYFVWDPTLGTRGAYVTRDLSAGTNNITSNVDNYLQPGQACFVQTNTAAAAALSFTEANKYTAATNQGVMRTIAPISGTATPASPSASIRLTLFNKNLLSQGIPSDGAVVLFNVASANEVDANDCSKMTNLDENLAVKSNGKLLSIEKKAVPTATDEIELAITQYRAKDYTLVAQGTNLEGVTAYLVDQYTKTTTTLPSSGSINYNFTVDPSNANSSAANRFKIIFQDATSATEFTENEVKVYPNPSTGGMVTISLPYIQEESKVSILNFAGETVYSATIAAGENAAINPNKSLAAGVYFVKMEQAGKTVTKKLIIK